MAEELTTIQGGGLALPDHLKNLHSREGLENVGKEDQVIPRLVMAQSTHPQLKPSNPLYIKGLNQGEMFNTVTGEVYGTSVLIIPLLYAKSRIYFKDLKEGGGILCRSFNGIDGGSIAPKCADCPNSKFSPDKPPACNIFMNFPSILVEKKQLIAPSYKSTALKPARAWVTRMNMSNKPMFAGVYEVKSNPDKNAKGEFFVPTFTLKRWTTAEEFAYAQAQYNSLKGKTILVDEDQPETEEEIPF